MFQNCFLSSNNSQHFALILSTGYKLCNTLNMMAYIIAIMVELGVTVYLFQLLALHIKM